MPSPSSPRCWSIPLAAAIACLCVSANTARWIALIATLADLALGILLWSEYRVAGQQWQFQELAPLFGRFYWALGVDGIAVMLIMLSVFLMPICILASWKSIERRVPEYMAAFLIMETMMLGVFMAQDIFLFYIFFEAGLIPMFLIIGIWGGARANLRQLQILPLHPARLGADAGRDAVDGELRRHDRHPQAARHQLPARGADLAVARLLRLASRSRCRCGRSTPGFPTPTSRRRPPAR